MQLKKSMDDVADNMKGMRDKVAELEGQMRAAGLLDPPLPGPPGAPGVSEEVMAIRGPCQTMADGAAWGWQREDGTLSQGHSKGPSTAAGAVDLQWRTSPKHLARHALSHGCRHR